MSVSMDECMKSCFELARTGESGPGEWVSLTRELVAASTGECAHPREAPAGLLMTRKLTWLSSGGKRIPTAVWSNRSLVVKL